MITIDTWWMWVERLKRAIGCPVDWENETNDKVLQRSMWLLWEEIVKQHQADNEMTFYRQAGAAALLNPDSLKAIEANASVWRSRAEREYLSKVESIRRFVYLSPEQHSKHFPIPGTSDDVVVTKTTQGDACFFSWVTQAELQAYVEQISREWWRRIIEFHPREPTKLKGG